MKTIVLLAFTAVTVLLTDCSSNSNRAAGTVLSPRDFSGKLKELPDARLVDVRTPGEFSKGHLEGAVNIDWNGDEFSSKISELDKTKPVFVYCLSGGRSSAAADKMRSDGFKEVYELGGGIMNWRAAGFSETVQDGTAAVGMNKKEFGKLILPDKTVLVDFYADWCIPCIRMKPYIEELSNEMTVKISVVRINADENKELCKELKIDSLPVLLIYKGGSLRWRHSGYLDKAGIEEQLH